MANGSLVISQIQRVTVVSFRNASILDGASIDAISAELYALVDQQAQRKIILDFSEVKFLASQMIGVLLALDKKVKQLKGRTVISGLREELFKVFKIMRLEKVLEFAPNEQKALNSFDVFTS